MRVFREMNFISVNKGIIYGTEECQLKGKARSGRWKTIKRKQKELEAARSRRQAKEQLLKYCQSYLQNLKAIKSRNCLKSIEHYFSFNTTHNNSIDKFELPICMVVQAASKAQLFKFPYQQLSIEARGEHELPGMRIIGHNLRVLPDCEILGRLLSPVGWCG